MSRVEDLLREEFGPEPPTLGRDAMLGRVSRVRRRRRLVAAVAGCAAVLTGATVVVAAAPFGSSGTPASSGEPARQYTVELVNTLFTDAQHGYVVQERCSYDVAGPVPAGAPTPDLHQECAAQLLVTADAGQTWQERALPDEVATKDAGVHLIHGHSLMLWVDGTGKIAYGGWHRRYWTTADAGVTWQESPSLRDIEPEGARATFDVADRLTFLTTAPPGGIPPKKAELNPVTAAGDGSFWVACPTGDCVSVSRDHGATWQTGPTIAAATAVAWVATFDGQTALASVATAGGPRLVRTTDGGTTWTDLLGLDQLGGAGVMLANGDLIVARTGEAGGIDRLAAGTMTMTRLTGGPTYANALYRTGGALVASSVWRESDGPEVESLVSVSTDGGTTWIAVPAPPA